jgi:ATP-dependent RNA helicase RhlE
MSFEKLNLIKPLQKALTEEGYTAPTPIQSQAIPFILERKDLLGCAQTGTGKTAAFALPILQILYTEKLERKSQKNIGALILTPTRELAIQISESFSAYGKFAGLWNVVVFGGVPQKRQTDKLRKGADILIATPGRLLDLMNQNYISLQHIKIFVLDEADRMLDMGFIHDVKKIIAKLPAKRQSLFFSATMPQDIIKLANTILTNPVKIEVTPESPTVKAIKQSVYFVSKPDKKALLIHLLKNESINSALVFTRTKHGANIVTKFLNSAKIHAEAIHGNKSQSARQTALNNFKSKKTRVLVATDIAARGIDVEELSHVINFEIPNIAETYIHRIGRTGRAGLSGTALSFCDNEERAYLKDINKLISINIPVINDHPFSIKKEGENTNQHVNENSDKSSAAPNKQSSPYTAEKSKKRRYGRNKYKGKNYKYGRNKTRAN